MKKKIIFLSVLAAAMTSAAAMAEESASGGLISLSGAISDTTCTINGGNSADFTIAMSPISVRDAGTTVGVISKGKKSFFMTFSDCSPASSSPDSPLKIYFTSADNISNDGQYLRNNSTDENDSALAKNVGFAFTESGSLKPVPLNEPYTTAVIPSIPESNKLTLDAYYYKTNTKAARVGELSSNVTYTISYN